MPIHVHLHLFATLARLTPATADRHPLPEGATAGFLVRDLGIPPDEAKLILVNGRRVETDAVLADGDRIGIFPPIGGG